MFKSLYYFCLLKCWQNMEQWWTTSHVPSLFTRFWCIPLATLCHWYPDIFSKGEQISLFHAIEFRFFRFLRPWDKLCFAHSYEKIKANHWTNLFSLSIQLDGKERTKQRVGPLCLTLAGKIQWKQLIKLKCGAILKNCNLRQFVPRWDNSQWVSLTAAAQSLFYKAQENSS